MADTNTTYIYGLWCPRAHKIRYVGASVQPIMRYRAHIAPQAVRDGRSDSAPPKMSWIAELDEEGLRPELVILERVENNGKIIDGRYPVAKEREDHWMLKLIDNGHPLTNAKLPTRDEKTDDQLLDEAIQRGKELFGE